MEGEDAFELSAAGLRADRGELAVWLEVLAAKLEDTLPGSTHVARGGRRLLSREKHVQSVEVRLGSDRFALSCNRGIAQASREREVAGIAIKRESLELDEWVNALTDALRREASRSASAREALAALIE